MSETRTFLKFQNPATGEEFGQVAMTAPEAVGQAMCEMREAFAVWSAKPVKERVRILGQLQALLLDSSDEITGVISQDCGKSRQDAHLELLVTTDLLATQRSHAAQWLKRERVSSGLYFLKSCYVEHRPHGVVGVIAPWNYPLALSLPPVISALLAGNTVILKPSEVTAATGMLVESLIKRVPELAPYVRVIHGDGSVGAAMIEAKPDYIFLTGSTPTGRKVMQAAAKYLIPVACELGGKDAMIVLDDADVDAAAKWGVWGAFFNAGQTCMAVERVYVAERQYDEFVKKTIEFTKQFKQGYTDDLNSPYSVGAITDPRQVDIIDRHLEDALQKGAKVLTGGKREGAFIEPTVMVDVDHSMLLMQEETFGPLMPIMKVKSEAEAVKLANDSPFGLGASVWGRDVVRAEAVARQVEASSVIINDSIAQFGVPMLPFGGVKESGAGRTHGREGLMQFTRPYSYMKGDSPVSWDVATFMREPGHYQLGDSILKIVFGTSLGQKWAGVKQFLGRNKTKNK
jgi:acyl-CoA reductase-like NAD-dependent aldehyde dehydrogenase